MAEVTDEAVYAAADILKAWGMEHGNLPAARAVLEAFIGRDGAAPARPICPRCLGATFVQVGDHLHNRTDCGGTGLGDPPPAVHHDITRRYQTMLREHHIFTPVCDPDPGTDLCHILWMIGELRKPMEIGKSMRWLGFVQRSLILEGFTTVEAEREFTRPYFSKGSHNG